MFSLVNKLQINRTIIVYQICDYQKTYNIENKIFEEYHVS